MCCNWEEPSVLGTARSLHRTELIVVLALSMVLSVERVWAMQYPCRDRAASARTSTRIADTSPPYAAMVHPRDGETNVPVDTGIEIRVADEGTGLAGVPRMTVDHKEVYPAANPDKDGVILTYRPPQGFEYSTVIQVSVDAGDQSNNVMPTTSFSFKTAGGPLNPWSISTGKPGPQPLTAMSSFARAQPVLSRGILYVRPKKSIGPGTFAPWPDFAGLLPLTPFVNAGITIQLINDLQYNPASDPACPACDILEIRKYDSHCTLLNHNYGHIYFDANARTWYWDTKGVTPSTTDKWGYRSPQIFMTPHNCYFSEGPYEGSIDSNHIGQKAKPGATGPADGNGLCKIPISQCWWRQLHSPLNLGLPGDGSTVQFNQIVFSGTGNTLADKTRILSVGLQGKSYGRNQVLARTLTHEMGHAILSGLETDHCNNPNCIMYSNTKDWEHWDFGSQNNPSICTHGPGMSKDIRLKIHNRVWCSP